jgi:hypothetical protein
MAGIGQAQGNRLSEPFIALRSVTVSEWPSEGWVNLAAAIQHYLGPRGKDARRLLTFVKATRSNGR